MLMAGSAIVTGGHLAGDDLGDLVFDGATFRRLPNTRIARSSTPGTGCPLSAAIAAALALGAPLQDAVALGLEYVNVPISPGATGDDKMERILETLRANADKPVFFHCGSGNRVGGAMIAHLMLDHGMDQEQAVTQAMRIGLRSPEYMDWGLDYARRHSAG
jgi:hypothetical protein